MASGRTFLEFVAFCRDLVATLDHVVVVTADVHELGSGVPKKLEELGAQVIRKRLPVGDYLVGQSAVVERRRCEVSIDRSPRVGCGRNSGGCEPARRGPICSSRELISAMAP